jgi:transposase-like protein
MSRKLAKLASDNAAPPKPKRVSKKLKAAIDALVAGDAKTVTDAAKAVGMSREYLSRSLSLPHVNQLLQGKSLRNLAMAAARASAVKVDLLESSSEIVRDRASSFILSISGITPESEGAKRPGQLPPGLTIIIESSEPRAHPHPTVDVTPRGPGALQTRPSIPKVGL